MVQTLAQHDHALSDEVLPQRELGTFRSQRQDRPATKRTRRSPQEPAEIFQLVCPQGRPAKDAATQFAVHPNSLCPKCGFGTGDTAHHIMCTGCTGIQTAVHQPS